MIDQDLLRQRILETVNDILILEKGSVFVDEIRIVDAPAFFDETYGTSIIRPDGGIAIRVAVKRPAADVADTVIHETAHVLLGKEHVENSDHGPLFQEVYAQLRERYLPVVMERISRG